MSNKIIVNGVDVIELIERDTPKKPLKLALWDDSKCKCGQHFNSFYHLVDINFCPKCGQRIDWSE